MCKILPILITNRPTMLVSLQVSMHASLITSALDQHW